MDQLRVSLNSKSPLIKTVTKRQLTISRKICKAF